MKVWVVYDPLYEEVVSVHSTQEGAHKRCDELDKKDKYGQWRDSYTHTCDEYEVEDENDTRLQPQS